jgi:hypothetical protein
MQRKKRSSRGKQINIDNFLDKYGTPFDIVMETIQQLPNSRMQDILLKRFGLSGSDFETLEAIGKEMGVTRERIRQIENEALKKLINNKNIKGIEELAKRINNLLLDYQGIASETRIINEFSHKKLEDFDKKALVLVLNLGSDFYFLNKPLEYERSWYLRGAKIDFIQKIRDRLIKKLEREKSPISRQKMINILNSYLDLKKIPNQILYSYIDIPKAIQQDIFGNWGIYNWPEINPRGSRDKIYLALKKVGRPLHFSKITKEVNKLRVDEKIARTPTIHNELIKDPRFILIGRGVYALKEWKYQPGTVKDVLKNILKKYKKPMNKDSLVRETLKQRQVKPATVILNLNCSEFFKKDKENLYSLK